MANAPKKTTKRAPPMLKGVEDRLKKLEGILEHLLYDVKGDRGEMLRKRFYDKE